MFRVEERLVVGGCGDVLLIEHGDGYVVLQRRVRVRGTVHVTTEISIPLSIG